MNQKAFVELSQRLIEEITKYNRAYYQEDQSLVSDEQYDQLVQKLQSLEREYPQWKLPHQLWGSVGALPQNTFAKMVHQKRMLSLANAYSLEDLMDFDQKIQAITTEYDYVVELKIDGLAISVGYQDGVYQWAATRGDGTQGENVTESIRTIQELPKQLADSSLEVRGEIYISHQEFQKIMARPLITRLPKKGVHVFEEAEEALIREYLQNIFAGREIGAITVDGEEIKVEIAGEDQRFYYLDLVRLKDYANCRNLASGSVRQLDPRVTASRHLQLFTYEVVGREFGLHSEMLEYLKQHYFPINPFTKRCANIEEVWEYIQELAPLREQYGYDVDGVVVKLNQRQWYSALGNTAKFPRHAIAYKYPTTTVLTKLLGVNYTVGRSGKVTPTARLEPVQIAGTRVVSAQLHNWEMMKQKDIRLNDYVWVRKAGEIIPEVVAVALENRHSETIPLTPITHCPSCDSLLVVYAPKVDQYCPNLQCAGRFLEAANFFVSKEALDIRSLSKKTLAKFIELGYIQDLLDIFTLEQHQEVLVELSGFDHKSVQLILQGIRATKQLPLAKLINSLMIPGVGLKTAQLLESHFGSLQSLQDASVEELEGIEGLGPILSQQISQYFRDPAKIPLVRFFLESGFQTTTLKTEHSSVLQGIKIVITGTFETSREQIKSYLHGLGAQVVDSVSAKTDYLLVGSGVSEQHNKLRKALSLGVTTINYQQLLEIIRSYEENIHS